MKLRTEITIKELGWIHYPPLFSSRIFPLIVGSGVASVTEICVLQLLVVYPSVFYIPFVSKGHP
jgi:hypothetical protein